MTETKNRQFTSSLTRVLGYVESAAKHQPAQTTAYLVWAKEFYSDPEKDPNVKNVTMLRELIDLRDEWVDARAELMQTPFPASDWQDAYNSVMRLFQIEVLLKEWGTSMAIMGERTLPILRMASRLVQGTELEIFPDELRAISSAIDELAARVEQLPTDSPLRSVLHDQVEAMRTAILDYEIQGTAPIRQALYGLDGALHQQLSGYPQTTPQEKEAVSSASQLLKTAKETLIVVSLAATAMLTVVKAAPILAQATVYYLSGGTPAERLLDEQGMEGTGAKNDAEPEDADYSIETIEK